MTTTKPDKRDLLWQEVLDDGTLIAKRKSYRRRFAMLSASAIGILAIILFSSYLDNTTPITAGATGSGLAPSSLVYPVSNNVAFPYGSLPGLSFLKYSGANGVSPKWAPIPNFAGQITSGGDIAVIDGTSASHSVTVEVNITNLSNMANAYSSFAFPLDIYEWCPTNTTSPGRGSPCGTSAQTGPTSTGNTAGSWVPYETEANYGVIPNQQLFLTNASGSVTLTLPKGYYYDLAMDPHQGSYYCRSVSIPADLSPSFYISAKAN